MLSLQIGELHFGGVNLEISGRRSSPGSIDEALLIALVILAGFFYEANYGLE